MAEAKIQFTPAQAAAIQARGGSLLVSAAAGSGKTRQEGLRCYTR